MCVCMRKRGFFFNLILGEKKKGGGGGKASPGVELRSIIEIVLLSIFFS